MKRASLFAFVLMAGCLPGGHPAGGNDPASPLPPPAPPCVPTPAGPQVLGFRWSPDGTKFLVQTNVVNSDQRTLAIVSADGGPALLISGCLGTRDSVDRVQYAWSPDSAWVAFIVQPLSMLGHSLVTVSADGQQTCCIDATDPREFAWSPDSTRLAYRTGSGIYVAATTGGSSTPVSTGLEFAWSPDGSRIAVIEPAPPNGDDAIFTMDPDGAQRVRVSPPGALAAFIPPFGFDWSPDSSRLLWWAMMATDTALNVYSGKADGSGSNIVNIPLGAWAMAEFPRWSPDSSHISYMIYDDDRWGGGAPVFIARPDGTDNVEVSISVSGTGGLHLGWSPDGSRLAYTSERRAGRYDISSVRADGTDNALVSAGMEDGQGSATAVWAPSGDRLAYQVTLAGGAGYSIRTAKPDGTDDVEVVPPGNLLDPRWTPDGSRVVYQPMTPAGPGLASVRVDGTGTAVLTGPMVAGGSVYWGAWRFHGTKVAYLADQVQDGLNQLFVSPQDTNAGNLRIY